MRIEGSTVLVTGARRGLGAEFVRQLTERGAAKIYATSRTAPEAATSIVEPFALDVTDPEQVARVAELAPDTTLLINNAGVDNRTPILTGDLDAVRTVMDTHFWGPLLLTRALAPVLGRNGGGAIVNLLSALSWRTYPGATSYAASKAAELSLTDATRLELAGQGTQVVGVFAGAIDTEMMAGYTGPMEKPADVVARILDGLEAGASEVLVDDTARGAKESLAADPLERYAFVLGAPSA